MGRLKPTEYMNIQTRSILAVAASALLFAGAGCVSVSSGGSTGAQGSDGGIFKTTNRGDDRLQKVAIPSVSGTPRALNGVNVATIVQDPQDNSALYIGTSESGMFYSYDGGESWNQPAALTRGRIPGIAVHPKYKCTIYVAVENKLLKSEDCSRSWAVTYIDARADKLTTQVAIDQANPQVIWISNSAGDMLRSADGGASWTSIKNLGSGVIKLAMHSTDSRRMFAGTRSTGVWRSSDAGQTWLNMGEQYKDFGGSNEFYDMAQSASDANTLIIATKYGLLRTTDSGDTWKDIPLLTAPGSALIYSVAIDPRDASVIYYGTSTLFYRTPNGGANWTTKRMPTSRTATVLQADRGNSNVVYMGVTRFK